MEDYIIQRAEAEGHFAFFKPRQVLWEFVKEQRISDLCKDIKIQFYSVQGESKSKVDDVSFQIQWTKYLSDMADCDMTEFCLKHNIQDWKLHVRAIFRTVAKYTIKYVDQERINKGKSTPTKRTSSKKAPARVSNQPDAGIQVLAGGVIGQMFRPLIQLDGGSSGMR